MFQLEQGELVQMIALPMKCMASDSGCTGCHIHGCRSLTLENAKDPRKSGSDIVVEHDLAMTWLIYSGESNSMRRRKPASRTRRFRIPACTLHVNSELQLGLGKVLNAREAGCVEQNNTC